MIMHAPAGSTSRGRAHGGRAHGSDGRVRVGADEQEAVELQQRRPMEVDGQLGAVGARAELGDERRDGDAGSEAARAAHARRG